MCVSHAETPLSFHRNPLLTILSIREMSSPKEAQLGLSSIACIRCLVGCPGHTRLCSSCHNSIPPTRLNASVTELCTIEWTDDSRSYGSSPEIVENDVGEDHYAVCFDVEMVVCGAGLEFAVLVDGEKVAAKNVKVQYTTPDSRPKTTQRPSGMTRVAASARGSQLELHRRQRKVHSPVQSVKFEDSPSTKRKREASETSARVQSRKKTETRAWDDAYEEEDVPGSWGSWGA
jgi:hypothetical protein